MTEDELKQLMRRMAPDFVEAIEKEQERGNIFTLEAAAASPDPLPFVCFRVAGITGSVSKQCTLCNARVWVAPSGQEMLRQRGAKPTLIVCDGCAFSASGQRKVEAALAEMARPPQ